MSENKDSLKLYKKNNKINTIIVRWIVQIFFENNIYIYMIKNWDIEKRKKGLVENLGGIQI